MKITYVGDPRKHDPDMKGFKANDKDVCVAYGMEFPYGKTVNVKNDTEFVKRYGMKFAGNSHFEVEDYDEPDWRGEKKISTRKEMAAAEKAEIDAEVLAEAEKGKPKNQKAVNGPDAG